VLLALTDRLPARRVYLLGATFTAASHLGFALLADGFWSALMLRVMAGIGWAGGLKVIADQLEGTAQSRAVSMHAAGVGLAGAGSFAVAGLFNALAGPEAAFLFGAVAAVGAFVIAALVMPRALASRADAPAPRALLDFRPVFRNRGAMGWIAGYTVHTWELAALRAWGVTFLAGTIARQGAPTWLPNPTLLFTLAGLAGIVISITGNELAQRIGRGRVVLAAMSTAAALLAPGRLEHDADRPAGGVDGHYLEWRDLHRQFGADRGHGAGCREGIARRHDGSAQHVRLCRRLSRPAGRGSHARSGGRRQHPWMGAGVWPSSTHNPHRSFDPPPPGRTSLDHLSRSTASAHCGLCRTCGSSIS
jgi:hypothetical protein